MTGAEKLSQYEQVLGGTLKVGQWSGQIQARQAEKEASEEGPRKLAGGQREGSGSLIHCPDIL